MTMPICALTAAFVILANLPAQAYAQSDVEKLLSRQLLETDQTLTETQKFTDGKVPPLPAPK